MGLTVVQLLDFARYFQEHYNPVVLKVPWSATLRVESRPQLSP